MYLGTIIDPPVFGLRAGTVVALSERTRLLHPGREKRNRKADNNLEISTTASPGVTVFTAGVVVIGDECGASWIRGTRGAMPRKDCTLRV